MLSEEDNFLDTVPKIISYRETVHTGNGENNALSNQSPQECVEAPQRTTTIQVNRACYHGYVQFIPQTITVSAKIISCGRCLSYITCTSEYVGVVLKKKLIKNLKIKKKFVSCSYWSN